MKARYWSLAIILLLVNYLIFATLFTRLSETDFDGTYATRTPVPTFTPAPAEPFINVPTLPPPHTEPTATATLVISDGDEAALETQPANNSAGPALDAQPAAQLVAPGPVNIRAGPGLNFEVIGTLNANTSRRILGRNGDGSWWQIEIEGGQRGWVSNTVVQTSDTAGVPEVSTPVSSAPAPAPAQPAASSPPPAPPAPEYQFTPTGWYDGTNAGITRFWGHIKDANGNPVDGVFVRASCGYYATISYPSGPVGWGTLNESTDWEAGFYDITVDERPVPCIWILSVVDTDDRQNVKATLSEAIPVEVTQEKSVIVASWQKNW